jgi:RNA polymerase sigma-70 factor (ECF subfamily)
MTSDASELPEPESTPLAPAADAGAAERDHEFVRAAQRGDAEAFAALVRAHQERALRVAKNLVANEEDARDLVQEAFVKAFRALGGFDFAHPFRTWLYRIVTNVAIDHLRRRRPHLSTAAGEDEEAGWDLPDPDAPRPPDEAERAETRSEVHAVLATLAPHFQSVLVLRELEGLSCKEIAEVVGATHVTVRWRLHRGRKLFQEAWERHQARSSALRASSGRQQASRRDVDPLEESTENG